MAGHWIDVARDSNGNAVAEPTVTVYLAGTSTPASIYSNVGLTAALANPFTGNADGSYEFFAVAGQYKIVVSKAGLTTKTIDHVDVGMEETSDLEIDVREFGDLFTGGDVSAVIQAALDYADGLSHAAVVRMPPGNFNAYNLQVPSLVHFRGHGRSTVINAPNGATGFIIGLKNTSTERCRVSHFWLQGNQALATVTGVFFDNDGGTFTGADPENQLTDMLITNLAVDGFRFEGSRGAWVNNVEVRNALNDCMSLIDGAAPEPGTDGIYSNIWLYAAGRDLMHLEAGANKFIGVKMGQAVRYGVFVASSSFLNQFTNCSVDGTAPVGWRIEGHTNTFENCDSFDVSATAVVFTSTADNNIFLGKVWTAPGSPVTANGVDLQAGSANNRVTLVTLNLTSTAVLGTSDFANNRVIANGIVYGPHVIEGKVDTIQLRIAGHSTQTNPVVTVEKSDGTDLFSVMNAGHLRVPSMVVDAAGADATGATAVIAPGTWTPTITAVANVAASSPRACKWLRVGPFVFCSGAVDIDPTAGSTYTVFALSLPIASDLSIVPDLSGTMAFDTGAVVLSGVIRTDTANNRATCSYVCDAGAGLQTIHFHFLYQVK